MSRSRIALTLSLTLVAGCTYEIIEGAEDGAGEAGTADGTDEAGPDADEVGTEGGPSGEAVCGDGVRKDPEACDGEDLGGHDCVSLGYGGGNLRCTADCAYDTSACSPPSQCGDGVLQEPEQCDEKEFGGRDCTSFGFTDGELVCTAECEIDTSNCK